MKRAAGHPVRALFLELHVVLNDANDVCLSFEIVDESLGVTHCALELREKLLSQLNNRSTSPALIGWRRSKTIDMRVPVQQSADGAAQRAGAMSMNDSHLRQMRQRSFIEKLI